MSLQLVELVPAPVEIPSLEGIALGDAVMLAHRWRERSRHVAQWQRDMAEIALAEQCERLMAAREWEVMA